MNKPRKTFKRSLVAVAVAGAATFLAAAPAHAYVMGTSILDMQNFLIQGTFDGEGDGTITRTLDFADFSLLTYTTTADTSGSLTGSGSFSWPGTSPSVTYPTTIDLPYSCVGSGCGALSVTSNGFEQVLAPPAGNYAAADQYEFGAPISGLTGFPTSGLLHPACGALMPSARQLSFQIPIAIYPTLKLQITNNEFPTYSSPQPANRSVWSRGHPRIERIPGSRDRRTGLLVPPGNQPAAPMCESPGAPP